MRRGAPDALVEAQRRDLLAPHVRLAAQHAAALHSPAERRRRPLRRGACRSALRSTGCRLGLHQVHFGLRRERTLSRAIQLGRALRRARRPQVSSQNHEDSLPTGTCRSRYQPSASSAS